MWNDQAYLTLFSAVEIDRSFVISACVAAALVRKQFDFLSVTDKPFIHKNRQLTL